MSDFLLCTAKSPLRRRHFESATCSRFRESMGKPGKTERLYDRRSRLRSSNIESPRRHSPVVKARCAKRFNLKQVMRLALDKATDFATGESVYRWAI